MQTELIVEAQIRKRPDGSVHVLGEAGNVAFGGLYADVVWADYQKLLRNAAGRVDLRILIDIQAMEPY